MRTPELIVQQADPETGRGRHTCGGGRSATGSCIELLGRVVLPKASCAAIGRFCWKTLIGTTSRPKRSIIVRRSSAWASSRTARVGRSSAVKNSNS